MPKITGDLQLHFDGYGFVVPAKKGDADAFIPARFVGDALHGDTVEAEVQKSSKGLYEGKITKILKRYLRQLVGRFEQKGRAWVLISEDARVRHTMTVPYPKNLNIHPGDWVVAEIRRYPQDGAPMQGEVVAKLPKRGTLQAEIEFVIAKHQLPREFPAALIQQAEKCRQEAEKSDGRKDLRHLPFVTIDGEDAKDFDDAVVADIERGGIIRFWVAIADVSHFVPSRSLLDQIAFERGTSVYFPGRVLPMLPEVLSNDLCSLRPEEDKHVLVAELEIDKKGEIISEDFYPALIRSRARLTYTLVKRMVVDCEKTLRAEYSLIVPRIETLSEVARRLRYVRKQRGSIDFDLPEPDIVLDFTGGIEDIERAERNWSHQIIEELMIAANEAVARFLTAQKAGCLYRTHDGPDPDRIRQFYRLVHRLGYTGKMTFPVTAGQLGRIVAAFKGKPEERLVNTMLLRSMSQAVYSAENVGHFGLSSSCYCHFTSPIRRYPDLVVHRLLKNVWQNQKGKGSGAQLQQIAQQSSKAERKSMEAEREMLKLHVALFIQERIGKEYEGIISHVTKFGAFVELKDYFVEGLIPMQNLTDDFYIFDEEHLALKGRKTKRTLSIGEPVRIRVEAVDLPARQVEFTLLV